MWIANLADDGPAAGGSLVAVLSALGWLVVRAARWLQERDRARRMASVPPTQLAPPGPAVDAAVLARLRSLEEHSTLSAELARKAWAMDDLERTVHALRRDLERLATQLRSERAAGAIKDSLLAAKDARIARLEEDLARHRLRVVEVGADSEHRDAAEGGPLQEALKTPLRPRPR